MFSNSLLLCSVLAVVLSDPTQRSTTQRNPWKATSLACTCNKELAELRKRVEDEASLTSDLRGALDAYTSELNSLRDAVDSLNVSRHESAAMSANLIQKPMAVAFSAKAGYNLELQSLDTVIFNSVQTNKGDGYDKESGKFTAPEGGTYFFFSSILSGYNTKVETAIVVNGNEITRMYSGAHDAHGSGSNGAVTDLTAGDEVWVQVLYQGGNHVHGFYSTFSGFLIGPEKTR